MKCAIRWSLALGLLPLAACSSSPVSPMAATVPQPAQVVPVLNPTDQQFAIQAADSDAFEIQSSQLALQKSRSRRVRGFAQHMIDEHTKTTQQLSQIAAAKNVTLQPALEPPQQKMMTELTGMSGGRAFDRAYLDDQATGHDAAVQVFQTEIAQGQDPELKAFAQQTLPHIQQHLQMAETLGGRPAM